MIGTIHVSCVLFGSQQESSANIDYGRNRPPSFLETFGANGVFPQVRNAVFVLLWFLAVSADPLFLFTPMVDKDMKCIETDKLAVVALSLRFLTDIYFLSAIIVQLVRTREVATREFATLEAGSNVGRRGSAKETLGRCNLIVNIFAVAPIPYVVIPFFAKMLRDSKVFLNFLVVLQYIVRFIRFNSFSQMLEKNITEDPPEIWTQGVFKLGVRSAFILLKSFIACEVFGAFWYFFAIQRETVCWQYACRSENGCELGGFNCKDKVTFRNVMLLNNICRPANPPTETLFNFGIFLDAIQSGILSSTDFLPKFLHCFLWGLQNLSSKGTNLQTSSNAWETLFALSVCLLGWVLAAIYIFTVAQGIIELSKKKRKLTEMKKKISPQIKSWLVHNDLPLDLEEKIVTFALHKLRANEAIDIKNIDNILPRKDLMDIKRHLCLTTLNKVSMFQNVSEEQFEVFCKYLKPVIYKADAFITREGEQFDKMLFITQGTVRTYTNPVADGRGSSSTGNTLGDECFEKGDFCGQELLQAWESTDGTIPHSTKNVRCSTEVEGFTLTIADMKKIIGEIGGEN